MECEGYRSLVTGGTDGLNCVCLYVAKPTAQSTPGWSVRETGRWSGSSPVATATWPGIRYKCRNILLNLQQFLYLVLGRVPNSYFLFSVRRLFSLKRHLLRDKKKL